MSDLPKPDDASLISPAATVSSGAVERVPNEFPDTCTRCGTTAPAVDGRCPNPKCRCLRKGTQLAAKGGPVNVAKRDQLRARFLRDYRPSTILDEVRVRELADITERLSTLKKGSSEYVRLVQTMASLDEALRSARAMQQPPDFATLSNEELIARLETLLASAREAQRKPEPAERPGAEPEAASESNSEPRRASNAAAPDPPSGEKESAAPRSEGVPTIDTCSYCNHSPCIGVEHPRYWSLHPEAAQQREHERRDKEFRLSFGLRVESDEPARPAPTDEERRAAAIRRELGWDQGVMNETTGYRYRE